MSWLQITFEVDAAEAEAVNAVLELCGALAVSILGNEDEHRLQQVDEALPLWHRNRVTGLFPQYTDSAAVVRQVAGLLGGREPLHAVDLLADEDWACAWMAQHRPIEITENLWVCPSWCSPPNPNAVNITLDPGLAFGTGDHPTTALCLQWLAEESLGGRTVVDFGCGSGVLAIAALKLGARKAVGIEIDSQARRISRENAQRNRVEADMQVLSPDEVPVTLRTDVLVANILAEPLKTLAPQITAMVRAKGRLALCGLLLEQVDEVWSHYAGHFRLQGRAQRGEWALLAATKIANDGEQEA